MDDLESNAENETLNTSETFDTREALIAEGWKPCSKIVDGEPCPELFFPINPQQKYCPEHQPGKKKPGASERQPRPQSVNVNVTLPGGAKGNAKADATAKSVEAGAAAMLGLLPVVFAAIGDEPCAEIFTRQIPAIAHQLGELARYHKGLEKFFAGAEGTGELFAWVGLAAVTLPALIAVVLHHNVVRGELAKRLQTISDTLATAGQ